MKMELLFAAALATGGVFDLAPRDGRKSFYGKAKVARINRVELLRSYNTIVAYRDQYGELHRTWSGWSATTGRHVYALAQIRKRDWDRLPVESL